MSELRLMGVGFAYRSASPVLQDVSLRVGAGELVALLGPNGSGKSTLLRLAAGLERPDRGTVELDGRVLEGEDPLARARRVAFLPQRVETLYRYRVDEVVALGRHPHRRGVFGGLRDVDRAAVGEAMRRTEVEALAARPFSELSGGERQRVLLASALAQGGDVLLLDEPTAALDLHHQIRALGLLRELAETGRSILCATHDLNLASRYAHRLILLSGGRVVADGAAPEVLEVARLHEVYGCELWVGAHPQGMGVVVLPPAEAS